MPDLLNGFMENQQQMALAGMLKQIVRLCKYYKYKVNITTVCQNVSRADLILGVIFVLVEDDQQSIDDEFPNFNNILHFF